MPNLVDFMPNRKQPGLTYEQLLALAIPDDLLSKLPKVDLRLPSQSPAGGFEEGLLGGMTRLDLLQKLLGLRGGVSSARNPESEPAYQAYRAGERASY